MRAPDARSVAASVVARVATDQAFSAAALDAELERAVQLDARDKSLATELVYGSLRLLPWLESRIVRYARAGVDDLDPVVRAHLVIATYQILCLTRVPAFAAVSEAVGAIRAIRGSKVGGFANAVLRKIAREARPTDDDLARATFESVDAELRQAIIRAVGESEARSLLGGATRADVPPLALRVERAEEREDWLSRLREARPRATFELGRVSPNAILARGTSKVGDLPGWTEGAWTAQEEGSQVVALALGARAGDVVLDACAGRGNKTGLLARGVGNEGAVDAADLHPKKLDRLQKELARIGQRARATYAVDWSHGSGDIAGQYDRVLIDAPCSGTGTIRRRPELALRRSAADVAELAALQRRILAHASALACAGGRVVYAVCSILREEAEEVIADHADLGLEAAPFDSAVVANIAGKGATSVRLLPSVHGTDGYFVASFVRRK